jgi:hypothetical protein
MSILPSNPFTAMTVLRVDAMYFHAAAQSLRCAAEACPEVDQQRARFVELQEEMDAIGEDEEETGQSRYEEIERLAISMDGEAYTLGKLYAPCLQALASTHILSAAALEAHVNARAETALSGITWQKFERLALEAKWLFLPHLLAVPPFDPGREPYQGFSRLVDFRNALVHYKQKREPWKPPGVPAFLADLGLTKELAEASVLAARRMISELATRIGEEVPSWLEAPDMSFFEVERSLRRSAV